MQNIINIGTGEVGIGDDNSILKSNAIGSCVVVVLFDRINRIAGLAHIMLPGKAPENKDNNILRYADNAINHLILQMENANADLSKMLAYLIGGGNVLKRKDDKICLNNIFSVEEVLEKKNIGISARSTGGTMRRSVIFDIRKNDIYITIGNSNKILLSKS